MQRLMHDEKEREQGRNMEERGTGDGEGLIKMKRKGDEKEGWVGQRRRKEIESWRNESKEGESKEQVTLRDGGKKG